MSGSNRRDGDTPLDEGLGVLAAIFLCCIIVGTLFYALGSDHERDSQRAAEYESYGERRKSAYCVDLDGRLLAQCIIEQEEAAREAYNTERDLNAQRDMATWALAVFIISSITAGLTLWALFYVRRTLLATLDAVEDTSAATLAMQRQNEIAEDTAKRQLRPYVAITETTEPDEKPFSRDTVLKFGIKNFGMTPATNVQISLGEAFHSEPLRDFSVPLKKSGEYGLMAPNDSRTERIYASGLSFEELEIIVGRKQKFVLRLRIDYAWPGGEDFHDITVVLDDPAKNGWSLVDDRRRRYGHQQD